MVGNVGDINPIRYRGYYYDTETGLYYLNSRYYDSVTGRFISQDDISCLIPEVPNGLNLWAYCGNNPVMNIDPSGRLFFLILAAFVIGGGINTAITLINDPNASLGKVVGSFIEGGFCTLGLAAGLASGGLGGLLWSGGFGFFGGFIGNAIDQWITKGSFGAIDWVEAAGHGGVVAIQNMVVYAVMSLLGFDEIYESSFKGNFMEALWPFSLAGAVSAGLSWLFSKQGWLTDDFWLDIFKSRAGVAKTQAIFKMR